MFNICDNKCKQALGESLLVFNICDNKCKQAFGELLLMFNICDNKCKQAFGELLLMFNICDNKCKQAFGELLIDLVFTQMLPHVANFTLGYKTVSQSICIRIRLSEFRFHPMIERNQSVLSEIKWDWPDRSRQAAQ